MGRINLGVILNGAKRSEESRECRFLCDTFVVKPGWVYILAGRTGTLYTGVTSDLYRRVLEHKEKLRPGFAARYDCHRLVFYEEFGEIQSSINREKQIKGWTRAKKLALINEMNPDWKDLAEGWGKPMGLPAIRQPIHDN